MKLTKSLFLAFAGLGLFACSNEEVTDNGGIQGEANVVVRISTNSSRVASDLSKNAALAVQGTATVYLETALGRLAEPITLDGADKTVSFEGVRSPGHIWVSVNGYNTEGSSDLPAISLVTANSTTNEGLKAPMFADGGNVSENSSQWIYDDDSKTYTGTLAPQHQIARLEFAGIKHTQSGDDGCIFESITFDGLFLNGIKLDTEASSSTSFTNWAAVTATEQTTMPCFDKIEGGTDFLAHGGSAVTYPKEAVGECYAYNIVGGDCPVLTLCFSNISLIDGKFWPEGGLGYATVSKYKAKGSDIKGHENDFGATTVSDESAYYEITKFPAGYIYQVTSLPIEDKNIGTTIDGEPVNVVATVHIVDWKLVNGQVEWTE